MGASPVFAEGIPTGDAGPGEAVAIVPVKPFASAKSRLAADIGAPAARALARGFLIDVLAAATAARRVRRVVVVCADSRVGRVAQEHGAAWVADLPDAGINAALGHAHDLLGGRRQVLYLASDIPCLTAPLIDRLVDATAGAAGFLCDTAGVGTTCIGLPAGFRIAPRFGPRSRAEHRYRGLAELVGPAWAPARHDIDTLVDLRSTPPPHPGSATRMALATSGIRNIGPWW